MQATTIERNAGAGTNRSDQEMAAHIRTSEIFQDYQTAFETATGLPLGIRLAGSFQAPLHDSKQVNPFCALMASRNRTCANCLNLQQRIEEQAQLGAPVTMECPAGLSESAVPVRIGERVAAFIQTGQVFRRKPSEAQFRRVAVAMGIDPVESAGAEMRKAYFQTRVMARRQYDSVLRLVSIFAQHLSSLGNQLMVRESAAEAPAVTRARAYIAEHQGDTISLSEVAKAVHMSAFYFCKIFKRATGLTFTEYLSRVRVEKVKSLLLNPHKRVSEAAYEAGFQSLSQFNRVFRRFAGESPSDYRERIHGRVQVGETHSAELTVAA